MVSRWLKVGYKYYENQHRFLSRPFTTRFLRILERLPNFSVFIYVYFITILHSTRTFQFYILLHFGFRKNGEVLRKRERKREEAGARPPGDLVFKSPSLVQFPLVCFSPFSSFRIPSRIPTIFPCLPACVPRVFLGVTRFLCVGRPDHRRKNDSS